MFAELLLVTALAAPVHAAPSVADVAIPPTPVLAADTVEAPLGAFVPPVGAFVGAHRTVAEFPTDRAVPAFDTPTDVHVALLSPVARVPFDPSRIGLGDPEDPEIVEYSDGYFTRLTIHRWASYLTVPLFAAQYVVGSKLIDGDSSMRGVHGALTGAIGTLFVVNTVTGGWNAWEARKDPAEKNRRTLHSVLMLLADAGFVATGALAHEHEDGGGSSGDNSAHRNMAIASMGTALVSYAIMLPFFRNDG